MRAILFASVLAALAAGTALAQTTGDVNDPACPAGTADCPEGTGTTGTGGTGTGETGGIGDTGDTTGGGAVDGTTEQAQGDGGINHLWWIIPLLIAVPLVIWAMNRRRHDTAVVHRDRRV